MDNMSLKARKITENRKKDPEETLWTQENTGRLQGNMENGTRGTKQESR